MKLVSACLLGVKCRYDGGSNPDAAVIGFSKKEKLMPVCPEMLGGLGLPRETYERNRMRVISASGRNVTENFRRGAEETLKIAKKFNIREAILKDKSPSCASSQIRDGSFSGRLIPGEGVTAEFLRENGIKVISEKEVPPPVPNGGVPVKAKTTWYLKTIPIVIAILLAGPFALPLVWMSPELKTFHKVLITIIVIVLTVWLVVASVKVYRILLERLIELQSLPM